MFLFIPEAGEVSFTKSVSQKNQPSTIKSCPKYLHYILDTWWNLGLCLKNVAQKVKKVHWVTLLRFIWKVGRVNYFASVLISPQWRHTSMNDFFLLNKLLQQNNLLETNLNILKFLWRYLKLCEIAKPTTKALFLCDVTRWKNHEGVTGKLGRSVKTEKSEKMPKWFYFDSIYR